MTILGNWLPARDIDSRHVGPMEVQVWDCTGVLVDTVTRKPLYATRELLIKRAIRRAIDLADAMQCVVCIDVEQGSLVINPGVEFDEVLPIYFDLRKR